MKVIFLGLVGIFVLFVGFSVWAGGSFSRRTTSAVGTADMDLYALEEALEQYRRIGGAYPSTEQGLEALMKRPETDPLPQRWVQMSQEIPTDPWDTPFRYRYPGRSDPEKPEVISAGPDREFGTEDDQSNQD